MKNYNVKLLDIKKCTKVLLAILTVELLIEGGKYEITVTAICTFLKNELKSTHALDAVLVTFLWLW